MSGMFYGCFSLLKLDLSNFNIKKVTKANGMFFQCKSLKMKNIKINDNNVYEFIKKNINK